MRIPLSRPVRAAVIEWCVAGVASLSCLASALYLALPLWLAAAASILPLLCCRFEQRRLHALTQDHVLLVDPVLPWILQKVPTFIPSAGTDTVVQRSDIQGNAPQVVRLEHFWQHDFGLTLALKSKNDPHNRRRSVRIMVWRCQLSPDTYRRLCVMVNWQAHQ